MIFGRGWSPCPIMLMGTKAASSCLQQCLVAVVSDTEKTCGSWASKFAEEMMCFTRVCRTSPAFILLVRPQKGMSRNRLLGLSLMSQFMEDPCFFFFFPCSIGKTLQEVRVREHHVHNSSHCESTGKFVVLEYGLTLMVKSRDGWYYRQHGSTDKQVSNSPKLNCWPNTFSDQQPLSLKQFSTLAQPWRLTHRLRAISRVQSSMTMSQVR